jgi:hypothetical protein
MDLYHYKDLDLYHYNDHNHTDKNDQYWGTWMVFSCFASSITEAHKKFEKVFGYNPSTNSGIGCQIFFGETQ